MPLRSVALCLSLLLTGCAAQVDRLDLRLGMVPPLPDQQVEPATAQRMRGELEAGLNALAGNDLDGAVAAWRRYVEAAPFASPRVREVRGYLTLLERERASRQAREAAAREQTRTERKGDRLHIALIPFHQVSDVPGDARAFNRAILAMVATDLARVPSIRVLERQRMDALVQELHLSGSGLTDPATAVRSGRMLGAGTVLTGTVYNGAPPEPVYTGEGKYTLSVALSDVQRGHLLGVQEAYGSQHNFFLLEKQIVHGILDLLGVKDRPAAVDQVHTRNWDAYAQFTLGLRHLAEDRFEDARAAFALALRFDPDFALAEQFHLDTPTSLLSVEQIRAEAAKTL